MAQPTPTTHPATTSTIPPAGSGADARPAQPLPVKGPANVGNAPIAPGSAAPTGGEDLPLPHERDESATSVAEAPDPVIQQAKRDIDAGLVDTDMHATPGLDAVRRKQMVPGPGGQPPPKGGA